MPGIDATKTSGIRLHGAVPILRVRDLRASLGHYVSVLGFTVDWRHAEIMASVSRDGASLMLCERDQGNPGTWVWIGVNDAAALFDEYSRTGAIIRLAPTNYPWAYEMHVQDPDGHVLRLGSGPREDEPFSAWVMWYRDTALRAAAGVGVRPAKTKPVHVIERLIPPVGDSDLGALAQLLVDTVESGSAVSFLAPLPFERAEQWWRKTTSEFQSGSIFLVARDSGGIVGTVQLHPAWAPNQPHRAEIAKLLVHRRSRRAGLGTLLMQSIEDAARRAGFSLLTLDTKRGDAAEDLYRRGGWIPAGTIPGYALDSDGTPHDAVIFYKRLNPDDGSHAESPEAAGGRVHRRRGGRHERTR